MLESHSPSLWNQWNGKREALRINFENTSESERRTFSRKLDFNTVHIHYQELGEFDKIKISEVSIEPYSD